MFGKILVEYRPLRPPKRSIVVNLLVASLIRQFFRGFVLAIALSTVVLMLSSGRPASSQEQRPSSQETHKETELVPHGQERKIHVAVRSDIPLKFEVKI